MESVKLLRGAITYIPGRNKLRAHLIALNKKDETAGPTSQDPIEDDQTPMGIVHRLYRQVETASREETDPVQNTAQVLQEHALIKNSSWDGDKWHGVLRSAAAKAASALSRTERGPEAAEEFVKILVQKQILSIGACGSAIGAVLSGYLRWNQPKNVLQASLAFFKKGGPIPSPRSLANILIACRILKIPGLPHEIWQELVVPTLHKKQLSRVPRSLSSAYLRGALECDLQSDGVSCMMDCLNQGSDTWKVLANLWDAGGGKLAGPLLTTNDMIVLVRKAKNAEDMDLLLNSSFGTRREQARKQVIGYVPSVFNRDMLWEDFWCQRKGVFEGTLSCQFWGSPLACCIIKRHIDLGSNQSALEVLGSSLRHGRVHMPVNAILESASLAGNTAMALSAVDTLLKHKSIPRSRNGRHYLRHLSEIPPPWGYRGMESSKSLKFFWERMLPPTVENQICLIDALERSGCTTDSILSETRSLIVNQRLRGPQENPIPGSVKILKATLRALCSRLGPNCLAVRIADILKLSKEVLPEMDDRRKDVIISAAIAALKHSHLRPAINQGALREVLGTCISFAYLPGRKSARTVTHLCRMVRKQTRSAVPFAACRQLDLVGLNINALLDAIESSMDLSHEDAGEALAAQLQTIVLEQGFLCINELFRTKPNILLENALSEYGS